MVCEGIYHYGSLLASAERKTCFFPPTILSTCNQSNLGHMHIPCEVMASGESSTFTGLKQHLSDSLSPFALPYRDPDYWRRVPNRCNGEIGWQRHSLTTLNLKNLYRKPLSCEKIRHVFLLVYDKLKKMLDVVSLDKVCICLWYCLFHCCQYFHIPHLQLFLAW